jgi:hypothetical protein
MLSFKCHVATSISLHYSPFPANLQWKTFFLGKNVISPHFVPGSVVEEEQPNYSVGDGNYFCVTCNLRCCSCNICTCSSSSLIRRSRFAKCFLKIFSSSHCREYALCNCNKMSYSLLDSLLYLLQNLNRVTTQEHTHNTLLYCWFKGRRWLER